MVLTVFPSTTVTDAESASGFPLIFCSVPSALMGPGTRQVLQLNSPSFKTSTMGFFVSWMCCALNVQLPSNAEAANEAAGTSSNAAAQNFTGFMLELPKNLHANAAGCGIKPRDSLA